MPSKNKTPKSSTTSRLRLNRKKGIALGAVILVVIIVIAVVLATSSSSKKTARKSNSNTTPQTTMSNLGAHLCPLTDTPAPGGVVPARPALGVKIGNEPPPGGPRPQSGLNEADIVFDTPAEGFIMRYIAVYQCQSASSIGPTRSLRWVDTKIMRQFIHPILASAGGITYDVDPAANAKWLYYVNFIQGTASAQSAAYRINSRIPPENLYTSTEALYKLEPQNTAPPSPVFQFTSSLPSSAKPVTDVGINFSYGTDVIWKWDPTIGQFLHTYSGQQDIDTLTGKPVSATNIVIQIVHYKLGAYSESLGGSGDIESETLGSGPGWVVRNGKEIAVTWHRPSLIDGMTFTDSSGDKVGLAPGRTWVEMVTTAQDTGPTAITFTK